ncbi:hypothetical protein B0H66DRAFT_535147 [Apodospora peruviana]|uniref:NAD(P)-binding protein n=1 Tax=Apodospora peruviana TaxID=516989 RepID=A0AAE0I1P9_9PEZI|nr:hypothetical protein B0H66DRAFT_535147 [Apodospora peruviana]
METVLVVGATGNIGVSAVISALRSGRKVLAIVRNQTSADKLRTHIANIPSLSFDGITFVKADVTSETGVRGVVDQVRAGKLPGFQHVFSCVGGDYNAIPLTEITTEMLRRNMNLSFEANFCTSHFPWLGRETTWTSCTGAQGDIALMPVPAIPQGALFSFCTAASRENETTNVRFNEIYLAFRVEVDELAAQHGVTPASEFAGVYEQILGRPEIRSSRVRVESVADIEELKFKRKF